MKAESAEFAGGFSVWSGDSGKARKTLKGFGLNNWKNGFPVLKIGRGAGLVGGGNFALHVLSSRCLLKIQVGYMSLEFRGKVRTT